MWATVFCSRTRLLWRREFSHRVEDKPALGSRRSTTLSSVAEIGVATRRGIPKPGAYDLPATCDKGAVNAKRAARSNRVVRVEVECQSKLPVEISMPQAQPDVVSIQWVSRPASRGQLDHARASHQANWPMNPATPTWRAGRTLGSAGPTT